LLQGGVWHPELVRTPSRRPRRREVADSTEADLADLAGRARYVGSAEHKTYPSPAGPPKPRADATKCDPKLHGDYAVLLRWLRQGIEAGKIGGPWDGDFPRYVWYEHDGVVYEARLVNQEQGAYKGYQILEHERPEGI
jgi:hypothetical protein